MPNLTKDLGPVSGYAIAVEHGYQGTEAEWIQLVLDTTEKAQEASDAADRAESAAETAADEAVRAAAEQLQGYVDEASASASSAEDSADTAQAVLDSIPPDYTEMTNRVLDLYPRKTVSGAPAVIDNEINRLPLISLSVPFSGMQTGSGDPSPENYRPFVMPQAVTVHHRTDNLYGGDLMIADFARYLGKTISGRTISFKGNDDITTPHPPCIDGTQITFKENTQYTIILTYKTGDTSSNLRIYYTDGTYTTVTKSTEKVTKVITTAAGKTFHSLRIYYGSTLTTTLYPDECGIFEGIRTAEDFVAYDVPVTVSLEAAGPAYAGSVDAVSGVIEETYRLLTLTGTETWNTIPGTSSGAPYYYTDIGPFRSVVNDTDVCTSIPHAAVASDNTVKGMRIINSNAADAARLMVRTDDSREDFTAWLAEMYASESPVQVTYKLYESQTHETYGTQIQVYTGYNAFGTDASDTVTAEYYSTPNEKADRKVVNILAVGSSFTQGVWGYVPAILRQIAPDTVFNFGVLYRSGTEIGAFADHPNASTWSGSATIFNEWPAEAEGWTRYSGLSLNQVLALRSWDIVYGQVTTQVSGTRYSTDIATAVSDSRRFMALVRVNNADIKLVTGSYQGWPSPGSDDVASAAAIGRFYDDCVAAGAFEDYIPVGAAISSARLKAEARRLGKIGLMRYNRTTAYGSGHLQNGTPLLIAAYVITAKLLSWCGYDHRGILGSAWVPTADEIVRIGCMTQAQMDADGIGMTHGTPVFMDPSDPAGDLAFAQETALLAIENPDMAVPPETGALSGNEFDRITEPYNDKTVYEPGDYCMYRGSLWRCRTRTVPIYDPTAAYTRGNTFTIGGTICSIIPEYSTSETYEINDCCLHNGDAYFCVENVTAAESFDASKWQIFSEHSAAVSYAQGATVKAGVRLYFCNTATSGSFDAASWDEIGRREGSLWVRVSGQSFDETKWERKATMTAALEEDQNRAETAEVIGYGACVIREASGNPAAFDDAAAGVPYKEITVTMQGSQSGSGTPDPENIRPISGYGSLRIFCSGATQENPDVYPAQLTTQTNSIYAGTYNARTGVLTGNAALFTFNGTEANWREIGSGQTQFFRYITGRVVSTPRACSHFANKTIVTTTAEIGYYAYNYSTDYGAIQIRPGIEGITNLAGWRQWLQDQAAAGTPLQCFITRETPVVYQLPKIAPAALDGWNTVWSDAGPVTVQYAVDPNRLGCTSDPDSRRAQALIRKASLPYASLKTIRASSHLEKYFSAGGTYFGLPYSGMEWAGRDVLYDLSLEAIYSAWKNPYSDLYTYDWEASNPPSRTSAGAAVWAGSVCSTWVSWVTNRPLREVVDQMDHELVYKTINGLEDLEVGDVMLQSGHVAVITGLQVSRGEVIGVNVSEMWMPNFRSLWYTPAEFWSRLYGGGTKENPGSNPFKVGRFPDDYKIRSVPEAEIVDDIISSRGDNAHFQLGEDILLYITETDPELTIIAPDGTSTTFDYTTITPEMEDGEPIPVYNFKTVLDSVGLWKIKGASGKYWSRVTVYDIPGDVTAVQTQSGSTYTTTVTVGTHSGCSIAGFQVLTMYKDRGIYPVPAEAAAQGFVGAHGTTWKQFHDVVTSSPFTINITQKHDDNYFVRVYFQTGCGYAFKDSNPIFADGDSGDDDIPTPES